MIATSVYGVEADDRHADRSNPSVASALSTGEVSGFEGQRLRTVFVKSPMRAFFCLGKAGEH
jgi:hypothetical protein